MSGTLNQIVPWAIPRTPDRLHAFLGEVFAIDVPRTAITEGASSPFDYLVHAFFEPGMRDEEGPEEENQTTGDCVVWASRGSGKTFYSAIATALDLIFKPGVEVRVLGGSLEQASRMYEHLRDVFDQDDLAPLVDGRITERKLQLVNGSRVALLAASQTSVRGVRPNILRCDEVDLFDPDVWRAATLTTRSAKCGDVLVRGRIEALSTWHLAGGMMSRLVPNAQLEGRKSFRWSVLDVLERCRTDRDCEACELLPECAGRAKRDDGGHVAIDDAIAMKKRSDEEGWRSEMLCERPARRGAVYPEFNREIHVVACPMPDGKSDARIICGMDFGFRSPMVLLVASVDEGGVIRIHEEHVARETTLNVFVDKLRGFPRRVSWVGVDPAGHQRSEQTGYSNITFLRQSGFVVQSRRAELEFGLRAVRRRLYSATKEVMLFVDPSCSELIRSLEGYAYAEGDARSVQPVKDGHDHAADALRYLVLNLDHPYREQTKLYWNGYGGAR